jgi:hypothetical protein
MVALFVGFSIVLKKSLLFAMNSPQGLSFRMSKTNTKKLQLVGVLLATFFNLTGCSNKDSSAENSISGTSIESETKKSGTLTIPEDFPSSIPIHPGEVVVSATTGTSTSKTWVIEVLVDNLEKARAKTITDLNQAGFQIKEEIGLGTNEYRATFSNSNFIIRLKIYLESDTNQREVMYVVTYA